MTKLRVKCVPVAGIVKGIVMACLGFINTGGEEGGGVFPPKLFWASKRQS